MTFPPAPSRYCFTLVSFPFAEPTHSRLLVHVWSKFWVCSWRCTSVVINDKPSEKITASYKSCRGPNTFGLLRILAKLKGTCPIGWLRLYCLLKTIQMETSTLPVCYSDVSWTRVDFSVELWRLTPPVVCYGPIAAKQDDDVNNKPEYHVVSLTLLYCALANSLRLCLLFVIAYSTLSSHVQWKVYV